MTTSVRRPCESAALGRCIIFYVLLRKLKFDNKDPILGSKYGELKNINELICNEPAEFNLRVDYGLHSDIREFFGKH